MGWEMVCGDVVEWAAEYDGEPFHALLTDAPYEMSFMGRDWDASGVSFDPKTWRALAEHLLPGAFLFVFGGTINDDLISVAMRRAGLRKHHKMFVHLNGQGFPKATRIDTQIDSRKGFGPNFAHDVQDFLNDGRKQSSLTYKDLNRAFGFPDNSGMAGHWCGDRTQPIIPRLEYWLKLKKLLDLDDRFDDAITAHEREVVGNDNARSNETWFTSNEWNITTPATDLARTWQGHRYGGQCLKPSADGILVFQKPYAGRPVDSITGTGAGSLWIDGGRVGVNVDTRRPQSSFAHDDDAWEPHAEVTGQDGRGRWPPNFALTHLPECRREGVRRVKGTPKSYVRHISSKNRNVYSPGLGEPAGKLSKNYADPDGTETVTNFVCAEGCPVKSLDTNGPTSVTGKRSERSRNASVENTQWLTDNHRSMEYPGDKGGPSRFFHQSDWSHEVAEQIANADAVRYQAKAGRKERSAGLGGKRSDHPTVKPIALTKWLATLLLPPPEYAPRRILVPFSGSGSEMIGALLAGWDEIVGIELEPDYASIARARLTWWEQQANIVMFNDVKQILKAAG